MAHSSDEKTHGSHVHPAPGSRAHEDQSHAEKPATSVHPAEPGDADSVPQGTSRQNEVLGGNVDGAGKGDAQPHPETPAGQHATGSFTGEKGRRKTA